MEIKQRTIEPGFLSVVVWATFSTTIKLHSPQFTSSTPCFPTSRESEMWLTSTQIMESKFVVVILLNLYSQTRRTSFFPGQIYEKKEQRWDLRRSRNELSFYLFFLLLCSVWLTNVDTSPPVQPWRLLLLLINLFFCRLSITGDLLSLNSSVHACNPPAVRAAAVQRRDSI